MLVNGQVNVLCTLIGEYILFPGNFLPQNVRTDSLDFTCNYISRKDVTPIGIFANSDFKIDWENESYAGEEQLGLELGRTKTERTVVLFDKLFKTFLWFLSIFFRVKNTMRFGIRICAIFHFEPCLLSVSPSVCSKIT